MMSLVVVDDCKDGVNSFVMLSMFFECAAEAAPMSWHLKRTDHSLILELQLFLTSSTHICLSHYRGLGNWKLCIKVYLISCFKKLPTTSHALKRLGLMA